MSKNEELQGEIVDLEKQFKVLSSIEYETRMENKKLKTQIPPKGLVWITREEHKDYEQQQSSIQLLANALKEAAEIIGLNVDFDVQKSVPDKYRELAEKYLND